MARTRDLLIEIGTEELPPKSLSTLSEEFERGMVKGLVRAGLTFSAVQRFSTPRRLALLISDLPLKQPDQRKERRGPALSVAYDQQGKPTKAAEGFALSCGVAVADLQTLETDKGAWLIHIDLEPGEATVELIPKLLQSALSDLPIPKRMRWGDQDDEFVRPVHWLVLLFGEEVIPATLFGIPAGRETRGHRFHRPTPLYIHEPTTYAAILENEGKIIADFNVRLETIRSQADEAAQRVGGRAVIDSKLLEEVTSLVEWPVVLLGNFERHFLEVPAEVLITTMQGNQKYFPVLDAAGHLMPYFIAIANLESKEPHQVLAGNERVIRPRFRDAEFFWLQDRKVPLCSRQEALKTVVFQQRLGTLYDKSERVAFLARYIASQTGGDPDCAERAARLGKCDLLTQMVQEFPELQGIMGRYYARYDGEAAEVAQALEEQYRPRFAGDELPATLMGKILALADRLDSLIGIFALGESPSGNKDPFALRRAALGLLRILVEADIDLDLEELLEQAAGCFETTLKAEDVIEPVFDFAMERLRSYYQEQGFHSDSFEAVLSCRPTRPLDFDRRLRALTEFRELPEAKSLAAANKRIRNILKKVRGTLPFRVQTDILQEEAEQSLAGRLAEVSSEVIPLMEAGLYSEALERLADLQRTVDDFFDRVMVMTEDIDLRSNRIALLNELESLFLRIADFSQLQE
jgi:glycyl-tRNA synthetase beta chain